MTIARDIIKGAFRLLGIGTPNTAQFSIGIDALNEMLDLWAAERLLVHTTVPDSFALTVNKASYSLGPTGDIVTLRPTRIISAYIRDSMERDFPLNGMSQTEYLDMEDKSEDGRPDKFFLSPEMPNAKIFLNKSPDVAETLFLSSWKPFSDISLDDTVNLPPEYIKALRFNLAVDLSPEYDVQMMPAVYAEAEKSKFMLRALFSNTNPVSTVKFDKALRWRNF